MFEKGIFNLFKNQTGQTILIFVLIMVVALTIVLSVVSRSVTNLKISQEQVSSQKALSAAEAGIERAIANPSDVNLREGVVNTLSDQATYTTSLSEVLGSTNFLLYGGNKVTKNDYVYVWTTPYSETNRWQDPWNGDLKLYWGDLSDGCSDAALEITVVSHNDNDVADPTANPILTRYAYDPCFTRPNNGFNKSVNPGDTINNVDLHYSVTITLKDAYLVSVAPIYADSYIGAGKANATDPDLPNQGSNIAAVGSVKMADTKVQRALSDFQGFPQIPAELFPYTIFSP